MENKTPKRIPIVGGGFAGLTVAMELERKLAREAFDSSTGWRR